MSLQEFKTVTLADVSMNNKGEYGIGASAVDYSDDLYTYLRITDINDDGTLNNDDLKSVDDNDAKNYLLKENDIVFARTGNSTGKAYYYNKMDGELVYAGFLIKFSLDPEKINPKFIKYYVLSEEYKGWVNSMCTGSTRPNINAIMYGNMEFLLPPREQQDFLVNILEEIDKKIEVNKKINKNLNAILDLIIGEIINNSPSNGLKTFKIDDLPLVITDYVANGSFASLKENVSILDTEDYAYFIRNTDLKSRIFEKYVDKHSYDFLKKSSLYGNEIIISNVGDVGSVYLCPFLDKPMTLGNNMIMVKSKDKESYLNFYLYLLFKSEYGQYLLSTITTGSVQLKFNKTMFRSLEIVIPTEEKLTKFNKIVNPIFEQIKINQEEINKLQKLRDTLLPKLMSGEIDVSKINCDLTLRIMKFILNPPNYLNRGINMKTKIISKIQNQMKEYLNPDQYIKLTNSLLNSLQDVDIIDNNNELCEKDNFKLLDLFLSAKQVEGCSPKTITYYKSTIEKMLVKIKKQIYNINTDDLRKYLFDHKNEKQSSKTTIDNIRRILSSFFSWLEDEDYILKNPVRRIHKVKTGRTVKEVLTDENLETLRDKCDEIRDLAMLELLISTGIRVGELVRLNISDIDFYERECVVFGKGESERIVYFDARTKIHLMQYIQQRTDENPALFVSLNKPNTRLGISGIETRLRELGEKCNIKKVHPHKFRRTMATNAIDKGMPIEQVQKLLGHVQIDTTMQYAMVNQSNVKHAHRKFIG